MCRLERVFQEKIGGETYHTAYVKEMLQKTREINQIEFSHDNKERSTTNYLLSLSYAHTRRFGFFL